MRAIGYLFALTFLSVNAQVSTSVPPAIADKLDAHHLYLDARLDKNTSFAYSDFREAVAHLGDSCTLYIAPGVYWVDDPDTPEVVIGENGREPFGMVIRAKKLHFIGLSSDAGHTVLASQRGQMQGAVGNFTMFDFWCDTLTVENLTMGNFCNVDLDYPLDPKLSRKKRSDAITQAHVGYVHGKQLVARNVRFISRLNLNPLNGAQASYYENCHFECTDDAMNGTAFYRHCDIDLYGQKPFWSTFGRGPLFIDCDFYVKGDNREMYFCKQGGPVTLIDCRYHAPSDSLYIGWTAYPQPWLRCYQKNFTLNGKPYLIGSRQPQNTLQPDYLEWIKDELTEAPFLDISQHEATLLTGRDTLRLSCSEHSEPVHWYPSNGPTHGYQRYALLQPDNHGNLTVIPANDTDETADFCIIARTRDDREAACHVLIQPSQLPPPAFLKEPVIRIDNGIAYLDYTLDLQGRRDESRIIWSRLDTDNCQKEVILAYSNDGPQRQYKLRPGDVGHRLMASIRPAHHRSPQGELTEVASLPVKGKDVIGAKSLATDFSDLFCGTTHGELVDAWQADGFKPADTADFLWSFNSDKPMWTYGEGFNGAVGKGLLQAQRGARLRYTPKEGHYGDMSLTLQVDPTKTAGQGFGSATGQYMDVCLKFDTKTLTGYGLRIIRTVKYAKAVDFYLVEYDHGQTKALTEPVSSTCYRTGCTIALKAENNRMTAHVETTTPKPSDSVLPHVVDLSAPIRPNAFGGIAIQHTGSCGESTTMLHRLQANWK
jgi:hypothetical protein